MTDRGQSNVIGIALLLGVTVLTLGSLTASIGMVVDTNAATADATRVAHSLDDALEPVTTTGVHRGRVSFTDGELRTVERNLRVLNSSGTVANVSVGGLVFSSGDRRVAFLAGAIVRGQAGRARLYADPPITASRTADGGVLVVGAPKLSASETSISGDGDVVLESNVSHRRSALGNDTYRVAVETTTPGAWTEYFREQNATVVDERDFDGDGTPSVVARYPGERVAYLVVHDMQLEVDDGR